MKWNKWGFGATFVHMSAKLGQENLLMMVRWMRWHYPPDTGFEIRALAVWGQARYPSVTEAPTILNLYGWAGKKHLVSLKLECQSGVRTHDHRLPKQSYNTVTMGLTASRCGTALSLTDLNRYLECEHWFSDRFYRWPDRSQVDRSSIITCSLGAQIPGKWSWRIKRRIKPPWADRQWWIQWDARGALYSYKTVPEGDKQTI